jgi:hypothetical protein
MAAMMPAHIINNHPNQSMERLKHDDDNIALNHLF